MPRYVRFVAETGKRTCNACQRYDGRIFAESDTNKPHLPIHPNCRCRYELVQMTSKNIGFQTEKGEIAATLKSLHSLSDETAAELAEQTIIARMENGVLEKEKLFLLFNGRCLMSSDGQLLLDAVAGKAVEKKKKTTDVSFAQEKEEDFFTFDYSYARQEIKNEGGIPRGLYQMSCRESGSLAHGNVRKHLVGTISWGHYHWCLTPFPDTDMRGRDRKSFTIHGGHIPESGGCIDLTGGDISFKKYLDRIDKDSVTVCVRYASDEVTVVKQRFVQSPFSPILY